MIRFLPRVVAAALLVAAATGIPLAAHAETDGTIDVGVTIAPLVDCTAACVAPPPNGELAPTGLQLTPILVLALGLGGAGGAVLISSRRQLRSS